MFSDMIPIDDERYSKDLSEVAISCKSEQSAGLLAHIGDESVQ